MYITEVEKREPAVKIFTVQKYIHKHLKHSARGRWL